MIGRIIGNYRITSELAHGGMGTVYRGQHVNLPREIVVKSILLGAFSPSAQSHLKARFRREAYIQSQLDHPNIVRVYEFFTAEDNYYLVMEYVPGMSLKDLLSRQGVPTPAQAVYLCKQALSALEYAHNFTYVDESDIRHTGIIHRDIKPANMLLDNKGKLKITDFGIVKVLGEPNSSSGMTQTGFHPGTVEYMSPEQLLGLDIDVRSDLYSLGVTFYEMLSGRLPFLRSATGSDWEVRKGHIEVPPPPIQNLRPDLPPTLAAIIMRSLQKSPNERYQTAGEFLDALQIHERTVGADTQKTPSGRLTKPLFAAPTVISDAATLIAGTEPKPISASAAAANAPPIVAPVLQAASVPPTNSPMQEAETIPLAQLKTASRGNSGGVAKPVSAATADEETIVVVKPKSAGSKFGLVLGACGLLVAGTAAGAYFFSEQGRINEQNLSAQIAATPSPTVTPTGTVKPTPKPKTSPTQAAVIQPTATPTPSLAERASAVLNQAKALEDREQYAEAIAKYQEYQQVNPNSAESSLVNTKLNVLVNLQRALNEAKADLDAKRYQMARERYRRILQLKPDSSIAKAGMLEAQTKLVVEPPPFTMERPQTPPPNPNGNRNRQQRVPPTLKRLPTPTPKPDSQQ
ncbi:MAG: serine/threonine-protein kinase [Acidobacteriota bacterium]|nr:serine/threonine-protein kinase [Acidobacteriota bacterium]